MRAYTQYKDGSIDLSMFPLENMYITQGENGTYSHQGSLAMDFAGMDSNGNQVLRCPYYAPCDLKLINIVDNASHSYVYQSLNKVYFPNGEYDYLNLLVAHDDDSYSVGRVVLQGGLLGKTGTTGNVTGDHVHMECKIGQFNGMYHNQYGTYMMRNASHLYNALGVNDTNLLRPLNYPWRLFYHGGRKKKGFPWYIVYALQK